ncbi:MAG: DUF5684 domain-containing protein [Candidatus Saccharibacteria bacterium]|nr:DUF5684 domain-containing protein [Candidatus Saccharibacteria bacterium]
MTEGDLAILSILLAIAALLYIGSIISIIALWKIFKKAGHEGWEILIPIYNAYVLTKISGLDGWFLAVCLFPGIGVLIWLIMVSIQLSAAFNKDGAFAIGLILLPYIFYPILGFGKAQYTLNEQNYSANSAQPDDNLKHNNPQQRAPYVAPQKPEDPWLNGQE